VFDFGSGNARAGQIQGITMSSDADIQEDQWVARAVAGERPALDLLLRHFHDPLRQFIAASIALGDSAGIGPEDLLQETFIAAIRGIREIEPRGAAAFFAWLKTIAANYHRNMVAAARAKKRGGEFHQIVRSADDAAATTILDRFPGPTPTPSAAFGRKEAIEAIARAIAQLGPEQRELIDLYYHSRLSVQELAEKLGKSEHAIRTSIYRIHNTLRDVLAADFGEFSAGL
jgi:RNA polymerase sigma-70 factor (ECF subfamily)